MAWPHLPTVTSSPCSTKGRGWPSRQGTNNIGSHNDKHLAILGNSPYLKGTQGFKLRWPKLLKVPCTRPNFVHVLHAHLPDNCVGPRQVWWVVSQHITIPLSNPIGGTSLYL